MFSVTRVLNKAIVNRFYQQNSGLLLFVFFLMFGIVEGSQLIYYHLSLANGMLDSPIFMGIVFMIWLLYTGKCIQFARNAFCLPQNSFLFCITCLPAPKQLLALFIAQFLLFLPVATYGLFVIGVAIHLGKFLAAAVIAAYLLLLCAIAALLSVRKLNSPYSGPDVLPQLIVFNLKKSLWQFYFAYIFSDLKMVFAVTKLFSYFILFGFLLIDVGHYEIRIAQMGLLIGLVAHIVLIFEFRKWEDSYLPFVKNLPIAIWKRYLTLSLIYCLLLVPEWILVIVNGVGFIDFAGVILFGTTFLLLLHTILYRINMDMDRFIQIILLLFLLSFGMVLFQLSWAVTLVALMVSIRWFKQYFYSFEALRL